MRKSPESWNMINYYCMTGNMWTTASKCWRSPTLQEAALPLQDVLAKKHLDMPSFKSPEAFGNLFHNQILTSAFCRFTIAVFYTGLCMPCPCSISDLFFLASFMRKTMNRYKVNAWRGKYLRFFGPLVIIFVFRVVVLFFLLFFSQVRLTCVRLFYILIQHKVILGTDGVG